MLTRRNILTCLLLWPTVDAARNALSERLEADTVLIGSSGIFHALAWAPGGDRLFVSGDDGVVLCFQEGRATPTFLARAGDRTRIDDLCFSPDGKCLAAACTDGTVCAWDVATSKQLWVLKGHKYLASTVDWGPDARWLVSASGDRTVRLWDVQRQDSVWTAHSDAWLGPVRWSPRGTLIAVSEFGGALRLLNPHDGKDVKELRPFQKGGDVVPGYPIAWTADAKALWVQGIEEGTIELWDISTGNRRMTIGGVRSDITFMERGPGRDAVTWVDGEGVWQWRKGRVTQLEPRGGLTPAVARWSPDKQTLAIAWPFSSPGQALC